MPSQGFYLNENNNENNMAGLCQEILRSKRYIQLLENVELHFDGPSPHLPKPYFSKKPDFISVVAVATFFVNFLGSSSIVKIQYRCFGHPGQAFDVLKISKEISRATNAIFYRGPINNIFNRMAKISLEPHNWH